MNSSFVKTDHKPRELWIDAARGICMVLVLLGHNDPPFIRLIFGFHMPFFFILSGYLYKDRTTSATPLKVIAKAAKSYILPYFAGGGCNLLLHLLHLAIVTEDHRFQVDLIPGYVKGLLLVFPDQMPCCGPMWFLPALAVSAVTFYLIRKIPVLIIRASVFLAACICAYMFFSDGQNILPFALHTVCIALVFMETGYLLHSFHVFERLSNIQCFIDQHILYSLLIVLSAVSGYVAVRYNPVQSWVDIYKARLGSVFLMYSGAVALSFALMLLLFAVRDILKKFCEWAAYLGKHTIFMLVFDEQSNAIGGTIITRLPFVPLEWYSAFIVRSAVMAAMFICWLIVKRIWSAIKRDKATA